MNANIAAVLLAGEHKFGLVTKALKAKDVLEELQGRAVEAVDVLSGAQPDAVIPEGYVLVPEVLPHEQALQLSNVLNIPVVLCNKLHKQYLEAVTEVE